LEKARANSKIMDRLKTSISDTVTSQKEIMAEQVRFYKDVYDKKREFDEVKANAFMTDT
jgi:hypothetical protein